MSKVTENKPKEQGEEIREEFCGACIMIPAAMLGAGTAVAGANAKGKYQKYRKLMLWTGIIITLVSLFLTWLYLRRCKECSA